MFFRHLPVPIELTSGDAGEIFAHLESWNQAQFLVSAARAAKEFSWPMQCRSIVDGMTQDERVRVAVMLDTLRDHLMESTHA